MVRQDPQTGKPALEIGLDGAATVVITAYLADVIGGVGRQASARHAAAVRLAGKKKK